VTDQPQPQGQRQSKCGGLANVLYLDFDGVSHPEDARMGPRGRYLGSPAGHQLFEHAALLAEMLGDYPDVRMVLSTSWAVCGYEYARRRLPAELANRCIGSTFHTNMDLAVWRVMSRGEQVLADIRRRQPSRWFAVDDIDEGWGRYRDSVVITCPIHGMSSSSVRAQLVERLQMFRGAESAGNKAHAFSGRIDATWVRTTADLAYGVLELVTADGQLRSSATAARLLDLRRLAAQVRSQPLAPSPSSETLP